MLNLDETKAYGSGVIIGHLQVEKLIAGHMTSCLLLSLAIFKKGLASLDVAFLQLPRITILSKEHIWRKWSLLSS